MFQPRSSTFCNPVHVLCFLMIWGVFVHSAWGEVPRESLGASRNPWVIERSVATSGYDGKTCWVHARAGAIPQSGQNPLVVMTTQKLLLTGSDVFYALNDLHTADLGVTWSAPKELPTFQRRQIDPETEMTVCDFTPKWHSKTKTLLGTGQTVWYRDNKVMKVRPRATAYAIYDAQTHEWSPWKELQMPDLPQFKNCGAGSVQRVDLPNGEILLPVYFKVPEEKQSSVTVLRCKFDGAELRFIEHGDVLTVPVQRGFVEPSLACVNGHFYLTLRNDEHGYVTKGTDGLHFEEPRRWTFDDGEEIGNYNTQQHWVTHGDRLYLVYTRKGAMNDHVFRHRAPLFIAEVDLAQLTLRRSTEEILIPERGARLGNFGVTDVSPDETWITAAEWMQTWGPKIVIPPNNKQGADNSIHVVKIKWNADSVSE